jgi:hypothetical protein
MFAKELHLQIYEPNHNGLTEKHDHDYFTLVPDISD